MSRPYFIHIRRSFDTETDTFIDVKGGVTIAVVGDPDNGYRYGVSKCSIKDNYCKATGRILATGRAYEKTTSFSLPDDIQDLKSAETHLRHLYTW